MQKKYKILLFDADHTLLDYASDEKAALKRALDFLGVRFDEQVVLRAHALSEQVWTEHGLYDVQSSKIQKEYHSLYRSHVAEIFRRLFAEFAIEADETLAGKTFLQELCYGGTPLENAKELLSHFSEKTGGSYQISIATNGVSDIQRGRLKEYQSYCEDIFISEELGCIKPTAAFFEKILSALRVKARDVLMIGDSLNSDMVGAAACGMDGCWYNPRGLKNERGVKLRYEIRTLNELKEIL